MEPSAPLAVILQEWIDVFMRRSMRNLIRRSKERGLSMSQIGALFHIHHQGTSGVSDVGDDLGITSAAASQMLERLVQQELVVRSEDPHDRRAKRITLTDKGHQMLHESIRARQGWLEDLASALDPGEQEQIIAALRLLIAKANQLEGEPQQEC
jgi:DNA-binding MarR family transcriptional regulator